MFAVWWKENVFFLVCIKISFFSNRTCKNVDRRAVAQLVELDRGSKGTGIEPRKSHSYPVRIQCQAIIGPPGLSSFVYLRIPRSSEFATKGNPVC